MSEQNKAALVDNTLAILLHDLLYTQMPAGKLENLINNAISMSESGIPDSTLARHAESLSERVLNAKVSNMTKKLSKIFEDKDSEDEDPREELEGPMFSRDTEKEIEEEIESLRPEIEKAAEELDPDKDKDKLVEHAKHLNEEDRRDEVKKNQNVSLDDVESMISELEKQGGLNSKQLESLKQDLKDMRENKDGRTSSEEE